MCIRDRNTALQRGVKKECASPARDRVIRWPHAERKVGREESGVGQDDPCFGAKRGTVSHSYRGPFDALPAAQTWFPGLCVRGGDSLWSGGHGGYGYSRALRGGGDLRWTVYRAWVGRSVRWPGDGRGGRADERGLSPIPWRRRHPPRSSRHRRGGGFWHHPPFSAA